MVILAHRANLFGAEPLLENRLDRTRDCLERGWSVETDIRRDPAGRFYISHDPAPWTPENAAEPFCKVWRSSRHPIALNVKELGYEEELLDFLAKHEALSHVFVFDMELLEEFPGQTARKIREANGKVHIGARVSDRGESIDQALGIECASIVWLDEFDGPWATAADVERLKNAGRTVYAVAPDLHGRSPGETRRRWEDFTRYGVDGICTDDPAGLEKLLTVSGLH